MSYFLDHLNEKEQAELEAEIAGVMCDKKGPICDSWLYEVIRMESKMDTDFGTPSGVKLGRYDGGGVARILNLLERARQRNIRINGGGNGQA